MRISAADTARVCDAIRDAERRTSGEFVCVLARNASEYRFYPLAWTALLSLAVPWVLLATTSWPFETILLGQLVAFALLLLLLSWPPVRRHIVPRGVQRAVAHRAAAEQFLLRGLARTPHRRGVLLFVAEEERYAHVLADDGVASAVPNERWKEAVARLVAQSGVGHHADGFIEALALCSAVLNDAFPAEPPGNKVLPDKFYVLN